MLKESNLDKGEEKANAFHSNIVGLLFFFPLLPLVRCDPVQCGNQRRKQNYGTIPTYGGPHNNIIKPINNLQNRLPKHFIGLVHTFSHKQNPLNELEAVSTSTN